MRPGARPPPGKRRTDLVPGPRRFWQRRFHRWLERRIPPARQITLHQKNLFIFLSPEGWAYLGISGLVWIGATNFQNNLVLALCFLMLAILFVAIHQTFANLSGLTLRFVAAEPVYAGDVAHCLIELESSADRQQLELAFPGEAATFTSVAGREPNRARLSVTTHRRGWFQPGRFRLQSRYPLGIIRCWTWLGLDTPILVYPRPLASDDHPLSAGAAEAQDTVAKGAEDFLSLRPYVPGDVLSGIAWKHYAAGRGLLVREQVDYHGAELWLDYRTLPDADPEIRLSKLCARALELAAIDRPFGLRLPHEVIEPGAGDAHLRRALRALAECPV